MTQIKTYKIVAPAREQHAFEIKRMETIYEKNDGQTDEPHRHDYFIVLLVETAAGKHLIDFNEFALEDRQLWFISPGQVHQVIERKKSVGIALSFSRQFMLENGIDYRFIEDLYLFHDFGYTPPLQLTPEELEELQGIAEKMLAYFHSDKKFRYHAVGAWLKLLLIHSHSICALQQESNTQKVQASVTLLRNFKALLEENYERWHQVQQYAQALNITADYLNSSIKSLTGKSTKEHIQGRIMVAAKRLLRFSDFPMKTIAYQLGFSEPANFSQFFKKCTGIAPSKFRK
ncbi:MAG: helix-turn-helix domain-containing protein [Saprospiraceae bacterium]